ncbi:hypothetical protein GUJ93_ZPchr0001g29596 [Zizania palustris]|uniref:Uncharacterized protein n=1 Tax=Zizania palustris TaxID=103762 RepID=A0A8J5VP87_ZIZPA|nr:hypothetical protein GUJ93_ZPchr0001g29596 [Zizania palustris]
MWYQSISVMSSVTRLGMNTVPCYNKKLLESWRLRKKEASRRTEVRVEGVHAYSVRHPAGGGVQAIGNGKEEAAIRPGLNIVTGTGNGILLVGAEVKRVTSSCTGSWRRISSLLASTPPADPLHRRSEKALHISLVLGQSTN